MRPDVDGLADLEAGVCGVRCVLMLCKGESDSVGLGGIADLYAGGRFEDEARFVEDGAGSCLGGLSVNADRESCEGVSERRLKNVQGFTVRSSVESPQRSCSTRV